MQMNPVDVTSEVTYFHFKMNLLSDGSLSYELGALCAGRDRGAGRWGWPSQVDAALCLALPHWSALHLQLVPTCGTRWTY